MVAISVQKAQDLVLWLDQIRLEDVSIVGGKNASLGEMIQQLTPQGINVPSGFATTAHAYRHFIASHNLDEQLRSLFADLDISNMRNLQQRGGRRAIADPQCALPGGSGTGHSRGVSGDVRSLRCRYRCGRAL